MEDPQLYQKSNKIQEKDASELIPKYISLVQRRDTDRLTVLDIGCGDGGVTWTYLRPHLPEGTKIVAVDIEQKMLQHAKEHYPEIQYFQLDISTPKIPKYLYSAFDHAFSFYCFHWIRELKQSLGNIYKILKPGGSIFAYDVASHVFFDVFYSPALMEKWKNYINNDEKHIPVFQHMSPVDIKQYWNDILTNINFKIILCEVVESQFVYKNYNEIKDALTSVHPHYSKIPHALRSEFIEDSIEEFYKLTSFKSHSEETVVKYYVIAIVANKPH